MTRFIRFVLTFITVGTGFILGALFLGVIQHILGTWGMLILILLIIGWLAWSWSKPHERKKSERSYPIGGGVD